MQKRHDVGVFRPCRGDTQLRGVADSAAVRRQRDARLVVEGKALGHAGAKIGKISIVEIGAGIARQKRAPFGGPCQFHPHHERRVEVDHRDAGFLQCGPFCPAQRIARIEHRRVVERARSGAERDVGRCECGGQSEAKKQADETQHGTTFQTGPRQTGQRWRT